MIGTWKVRGIRKVTAIMETMKIETTERIVNELELMSMNVIEADVDLKIMTVIAIAITIGKLNNITNMDIDLDQGIDLAIDQDLALVQNQRGNMIEKVNGVIGIDLDLDQGIDLDTGQGPGLVQDQRVNASVDSTCHRRS